MLIADSLQLRLPPARCHLPSGFFATSSFRFLFNSHSAFRIGPLGSRLSALNSPSCQLWCIILLYTYTVCRTRIRNPGLRALSCVPLAHLVPRLTSLRITFHLFQPLNFLVTYEISMPCFNCPSLSVFRVVRSCIPGMAFAFNPSISPPRHQGTTGPQWIFPGEPAMTVRCTTFVGTLSCGGERF